MKDTCKVRFGRREFRLGNSNRLGSETKYLYAKGDQNCLFKFWRYPVALGGIRLTYSKCWYPPEYTGLPKKIKEKWMEQSKSSLRVELEVHLESDAWRSEEEARGWARFTLGMESGWGRKYPDWEEDLNSDEGHTAVFDDLLFLKAADRKKKIVLTPSDIHHSERALNRVLRFYFDILMRRIIALPRELNCHLALDKTNGVKVSLRFKRKLLEAYTVYPKKKRY
jgi:hypothetical protein